MFKNLNWQKILIIIAFLILVILMAVGLYYFFYKNIFINLGPQANVNNGNFRLPNINNGNLNRNSSLNFNGNLGLPFIGEVSPEKIAKRANGGLTLSDELADNQVLPGSMLVNGEEIYFYSQADDKFYHLTRTGQKQLLEDKVFYDVQTVKWSPQGDQAILEYPDGSNILYNFTTNQQTTLLKELTDFAFNASGSQIASELVTNNPDSNWVVTANPDGTGLKYIEPLGGQASEVQTGWSNDNQILAVYREGLDASRQEIFPIGQNDENFPSLIVEGRGFEGSWSPYDNSLIYSVYNQSSGYRPKLYLAKTGASGTNAVFDTGLSTWSNKCTIGKTKAYCGVPYNLPEFSGLSPALGNNTIYNFYEIDLTNGNNQLIASPLSEAGQFLGVSNVSLSSDEQYLYFVDNIFHNLYTIQL